MEDGTHSMLGLKCGPRLTGHTPNVEVRTMASRVRRELGVRAQPLIERPLDLYFVSRAL